jgi:MFS family permease
LENAPATAAATDEISRPPKPWALLRSPNFAKLWVARALSMVGDFFSYVAIAWLVLQLTGSSLALGTVLLVQAVPRAALMLVGGALVDRLSARLTMLASMGLRVAVVAPLAVLVLSGRVQLWEIYVASAVFGVVDALFIPAAQSILPRMVADHELERGNAVLNVTQAASVVAGPALAGLVVAAFGTGWAFAADAGCFAVGLPFVFWLPRTGASAASAMAGLWAEIVAGFRYAWADPGIRVALFVIAGIDFAANGVIGVGLPTLAHGRFGAGAAGLGILLGAYGVGFTVGALTGGLIPRQDRIGWWLVAVSACMGAGFAAVGFIPTLLPAAVVIGVATIAPGMANTLGITWLQRRTASEMQGRVMSLVMLASVGLVPVAYALAGAIAQVNPTLLFVAAGGLMLATAGAAAASRTVRSI